MDAASEVSCSPIATLVCTLAVTCHDVLAGNQAIMAGNPAIMARYTHMTYLTL